jgi:hypothetical protein
MVKKISNQIDNLLYLSVFTINSLIIFLFHFFVAKQSILQWGNVSNIPVIQKLRDNNFLPTDDYLAGATDSPNYIFAKLVDYLSVINQDMFTTLFFLKLFYIFFIPMLLMKLCFVLVERFKFIYSYTVEQVNFQKIMIFLMILFLANLAYINAALELILGILNIKTFSFDSFFMPFGWISALSNSFIAPSTFAFGLGTVFNILYLKSNEKFTMLAALILFFTTLLHPVLGLGQFIIGCIFALSISFTYRTIIDLIKYFLAAVAAPIMILILNFGSQGSVDAATFIDTYIFLRHPHHYSMSMVFGWGSLFWLTIMAVNMFLAVHLRSRHLITLTALVFIFMSLSALIQYLGTEVFKNLTIAELGPSRFTQYLILLSMLSSIFILVKFLSTSASNFLEFLNKNLLIIKNRSVIFFFIAIFFASFTFLNTQKLDDYSNRDKSLVSWLSENSDIDDVIFIPHEDNSAYSSLLSFSVRIFAERPIWVDMAYPFNHDVTEVWGKKFNLYKSFYLDGNDKKIFCSDYSNEITYLITKANSEYIDSNKALFSSDYWNVFSSKSAEEKLC